MRLSYWIEVVKRAYAAGFEVMPALMTLVELEQDGRNFMPACRWGHPKPYDFEDVSQDAYDYWRAMDTKERASIEKAIA